MKHYVLRLIVLVPFISAGMTFLAYTLGGQLRMAYPAEDPWAFRFWGLLVTLAAALVGFLITRFILTPVQAFVRRARQLTRHTTAAPDQDREGLAAEDSGTPPRSEIELYSRVFDQVTDLLSQVEAQHMFPEIVGSSQAMRSVLSQAAKASPTKATVFLLGESGTGKELLAQAIHTKSDRAEAPFLAINCMAIPENLLESELFGHEKGAFTGAHQSRKGKFEQANQGTIFLDEIGDMPLELQGKILRFLQERTFQRLGGNKVIHTDVRIIAATNKNLEQLVQEGIFRQDLYYRLNVFAITLPPLRRRKEDIPLLAEHFLGNQTPASNLSSQALHLLMTYSWPGNIRELQNILYRAAILAPNGYIQAEHLPGELNLGLNEDQQEAADSNLSLDTRLSSLEKTFIQQALEQAGGVQAKAAEILGIKPRSLWHRVKKYGIDVEQYKHAPSSVHAGNGQVEA